MVQCRSASPPPPPLPPPPLPLLPVSRCLRVLRQRSAAMVDSPKKTVPVPEIKPLDRYDFTRAKTRASVRWLLSKAYGSAGRPGLRSPLPSGGASCCSSVYMQILILFIFLIFFLLQHHPLSDLPHPPLLQPPHPDPLPHPPLPPHPPVIAAGPRVTGQEAVRPVINVHVCVWGLCRWSCRCLETMECVLSL